MMQIITDLKEWGQIRKDPSWHSKSIGLVLTMGAIHKGHLSLVERCVQENDITVTTIFVNPTQFNDPSDLTSYPKDQEQDSNLLKKAGIQYLLIPEYEDIYPTGYRFRVTENDFSTKLCGAYRPGHFNAVLTVVLKLLNIVKADRSYFGEKDYQQYKLIKDMTEAFFINTEIIPCPIIRESDGLAYSSRNVRLTIKERKLAPLFHRLLLTNLAPEKIRIKLEESGFKVDYIEDIDNHRYGAVHLGEVRLIDNVTV